MVNSDCTVTQKSGIVQPRNVRVDVSVDGENFDVFCQHHTETRHNKTRNGSLPRVNIHGVKNCMLEAANLPVSSTKRGYSTRMPCASRVVHILVIPTSTPVQDTPCGTPCEKKKKKKKLQHFRLNMSPTVSVPRISLTSDSPPLRNVVLRTVW